MSWYLVPSLVALREGVNAKYPGRDKASDGAVGDTSHQARKSSHNPDYRYPGGPVRAVDIDSNGSPGVATPLVRDILKAAIGDPRVWYVIWNRTIWSRTYGWQARRYTGSNPHDKHVHVSVLESPSLWTVTRDWFGPEAPKYKVKPRPVHGPSLRRQFLRALGEGTGKVKAINSVARVQQALNNVYGTSLTVDGLVGKATLDAWGRHEKRTGVDGRPRVPDRQSLDALARGRFMTVWSKAGAD